MAHDHNHSTNNSKAFIVGITLNLAFVIGEVVFGLRSHSLSLLSDAGHNFGDVLGLALGLGATILAKSTPSSKRTYGLRSSTILASLLNAVLLLVATGAIAWEAVGRFMSPEPVVGTTLIWVASIGVLINVGSALFFFKGKDEDLNIKGAFMHLMGDAVVALGVVITGFIIIYTGWFWLDPVISIVIAGAIVFSTWGLLKDSVNLALQGVPKGIDTEKVTQYLSQLTDVCHVHDLHIWPISTSEVALTAHLVMAKQPSDDNFLDEVTHAVHDQFNIDHTTIQIECGKGNHGCHLDETK